jgi:hypothetical protein
MQEDYSNGEMSRERIESWQDGMHVSVASWLGNNLPEEELTHLHPSTPRQAKDHHTANTSFPRKPAHPLRHPPSRRPRSVIERFVWLTYVVNMKKPTPRFSRKLKLDMLQPSLSARSARLLVVDNGPGKR